MMTALANGATAIRPVTDIAEAVRLREANPAFVLAGERDGLRIRAEQTGSIDFDFGNSPREFTNGIVRDKTIVMTTTNGTRALQACIGAKKVLIGSFLGLRPIANWIVKERPANLVLVCSGTFEEAALEDTLAAGALCEKIWVHYAGGRVADSAEITRRLYPLLQMDLIGAMNHARNGRKLLSNHTLQNDVWFCLQRETIGFLAEFKDGWVKRMID